jgi:NAD(P) transhydrogenase subunit alpha
MTMMFTLIALDTADVVVTVTQRPDAYSQLITGITVFVLAVFVGFEVIAKIPPTLHTPLMSGSNAISGITVVGAMLASGAGNSRLAAFLGFLAVVLAMINVVGGFLVTHRMLQKFRR